MNVQNLKWFFVPIMETWQDLIFTNLNIAKKRFFSLTSEPSMIFTEPFAEINLYRKNISSYRPHIIWILNFNGLANLHLLSKL